MKYLIGTRGSKLALVQTDYVIDKLKRAYPDDDFKAVIIKTTGDLEQKKSLDKIGSKGIFVKEIEDELLSGKIHMAVHSMKDMPDEPAAGLTFAKAWKREDPRDVLVLKNAASLDELPHGAVIGTGSKRRKYQLLKLRPDLKVVGIRGNIDTRLRKLYDGEIIYEEVAAYKRGKPTGNIYGCGRDDSAKEIFAGGKPEEYITGICTEPVKGNRSHGMCGRPG